MKRRHKARHIARHRRIIRHRITPAIGQRKRIPAVIHADLKAARLQRSLRIAAFVNVEILANGALRQAGQPAQILQNTGPHLRRERPVKMRAQGGLIRLARIGSCRVIHFNHPARRHLHQAVEG